MRLQCLNICIVCTKCNFCRKCVIAVRVSATTLECFKKKKKKRCRWGSRRAALNRGATICLCNWATHQILIIKKTSANVLKAYFILKGSNLIKQRQCTESGLLHVRSSRGGLIGNICWYRQRRETWHSWRVQLGVWCVLAPSVWGCFYQTAFVCNKKEHALKRKSHVLSWTTALPEEWTLKVEDVHIKFHTWRVPEPPPSVPSVTDLADCGERRDR